MTIGQFEALFTGEEACRSYLQARRWPEGVRCPRCGNPAVYDLPSRKWHWIGSLSLQERFSRTRKLQEWFRVVHLMLTSKKGMSALQIKRMMGFGSYETAWLMCHKVRAALMEDIDKLGGIVVVDETLLAVCQK
jgi:hypothetical protein